jgi:hypothetical protein
VAAGAGIQSGRDEILSVGCVDERPPLADSTHRQAENLSQAVTATWWIAAIASRFKIPFAAMTAMRCSAADLGGAL